MKKKLVFIASHLSTGGMPQYLLKQIQAVQDDFEVFCIEWQDVTGGRFIVQRNQIKELLKSNLISLSEDKSEILAILDGINPDIIHLQEPPEYFMPYDIAHQLYYGNRTYTIFETPHSSTFSAQDKKFFPDKFLLVSSYHSDVCEQLRVPYAIIEYPIEPVGTKNKQAALDRLNLDSTKKHIINVGLFTPGKNQAEAIHYAKLLKNYPIQFHFIGNQADNFREYWEPLMKDFPSNCTWWGERDDVSTFYEMADLFLFTSKLELMPLVVREAMSWEVPSLIYNLPSYMGQFDNHNLIEYLGMNIQKNAYRVAEKIL